MTEPLRHSPLAFCSSPVTAIIPNLPFHDYQLLAGINQTLLKQFDIDCGGAPAKAKFYAEHPELIPPPSDAIEQGAQYHAYVLDESAFERYYTIRTQLIEDELFAQAKADKKCRAEGFSTSLKVYKNWAALQEEAGRKIISGQRAYTLQAMRAALLDDIDVASELIECQQRDLEVSAFAGHDLPGGRRFQLKCRLDILPAAGDAIIDLKTARTAHPHEFARQAWKLNYGIQAAVNLDIARYNGLEKKRFGFLAQDKEPPFLACIHWLPAEWIRHGRIRYRKILLDVADAILSGRWPGYQSGVIEPPEYAKVEIEALAA